ncbi:unnamed protein product [Phyllotreta striolata]|uniref:Uncharacterized protein n=1 Tax=Phyllotreta striolata TaxID=444603 RepID=A0A9N9T933_PHYSR|nr:unnamed protein product [Phyllotreta striolata]
MKWYIDSLHTDVIDIVISRTFSIKLEKHIFLFHRIFKRFNYFSFNTYLDYMEDILAFYLDCEVKRFINEKRRQKKNKQFMRSRILNLLNVYLLDQKDRYHHVLMKMRADISSDEAKNCLDNIYRVLFAQKPSNKSDQAFCTAFILSERWKKTLPADCWPTLEELIKELYGRHPNTIQTNPVWKEITSSNESFIETIAQFHVNDRAVCDAYFKYVKSKSMDESVEMVNKDANPSEEPSTSGLGTNQVDGESEVENILKNCQRNEAVEVKTENTKNKNNVNNANDDDDDDDCIIVSDDPMYVNPEDLVFEILDDDDEEDNSTDKKDCPSSSKKSNREISFLESIDMTAKASTAPIDNPTIEPVSSPLVKPESSVQDGTDESRDILSRKVTRKKDAEQEPNITNEANNITEEANIVSEKTNDTSEENNSIPEEPNNITDLSQVSQSHNTQKLDKNDNLTLHSPHSTFINSPELVPTSESYTSPTSPDISSTIFEDNPKEDSMKETQNDIETENVSNEAECNEYNEANILEQATSIHIVDTGMDDIESTEPTIQYELSDTTPAISSTILYTQKVDNLCWGGNLNDVIEDVATSTPAREQKRAGSSSSSHLSSTSSPSDFVSPTFETGMDDFKSYMSNFRTADDKKAIDQGRKEGGKKRKRVAFSNTNTVRVVDTFASVSPQYKSDPQAIPLNQVLNDPQLKRKPVVIVERLSTMEIDGWNNLSERTRKKQRFENTGCLKRLKQPEMNIYHVIYDKSTAVLNDNDKLYCKVADDCNWRETQEPKLKKEGRNMNNGQIVGKRKYQRKTTSQKTPEVRKRGRPRKNT